MKKIQKVEVTFAFTDGGLGDNIARLSAIQYCKENYPHCFIRIAIPAYFKEFAKIVTNGVGCYTVDEFNAFMQLRKNPMCIIKSGDQNKYTILRSNLVDHAFHTLLDYQPPGTSYKDYIKYPVGTTDISKFNLPSDYIVIPMMFTAEVREFPPRIINEIVSHAKSKNLDVVFLGKSEAKCSTISDAHVIKGITNVDLTQGINLLDKTTLIEAAEIMTKAKAVITLDSGLGHLAATTDVPLIIGYTTVEPHQRNPQRNGNPSYKLKTVIPNESLPCRFCQSTMNFVFDHDFKYCFYGHKKCINEMSSGPWINALDDILKNDYTREVYA